MHANDFYTDLDSEIHDPQHSLLSKLMKSVNNVLEKRASSNIPDEIVVDLQNSDLDQFPINLLLQKINILNLSHNRI